MARISNAAPLLAQCLRNGTAGEPRGQRSDAGHSCRSGNPHTSPSPRSRLQAPASKSRTAGLLSGAEHTAEPDFRQQLVLAGMHAGEIAWAVVVVAGEVQDAVDDVEA